MPSHLQQPTPEKQSQFESNVPAWVPAVIQLIRLSGLTPTVIRDLKWRELILSTQVGKQTITIIQGGHDIETLTLTRLDDRAVRIIRNLFKQKYITIESEFIFPADIRLGFIQYVNLI